MKTLHIIKFNQSCAYGKIVVRLNGNIDEYPRILIVLDKIYKRRSWNLVTNEIYYKHILNSKAVDSIMEKENVCYS